MAQCNDFHNGPKSNQCYFITTTDSCSDNDGLIHYLRFPYCILPGVLPVADIVLFIWTAYLFLCLAITAEDYFCPALTCISKMLKLSQNVAGVTFLALGNGSPDIFSCIVALGSGNIQTTFLAFGAMFGAGLFVNTVVIGAVTLSQQNYSLARRPFFRDVIFYLVAIYWTWFNCYSGKLSLSTGIGYIALYVIYVALVIIGRYVFQNYIKSRDIIIVNPGIINKNYIEEENGGVIYNRKNSFNEEIEKKENYADDECQLDDEKFENKGFQGEDGDWTGIPGIKSHAFTRAMGVAQTLPYLSAKSASEVPYALGDEAETPLLRPETSVQSINPIRRETSRYPPYSFGACKQLMKNFVLAINPLNIDDWDKNSLLEKVIDVLSVPAKLIFTLSIPVVDLTTPLYGWNKLLNAMQLLICPICACILLQQTTITAASVPVPVIAGLCGLLLMIMILLTSSHDEPPVYFKPIYTIVGFVMSIIWIYTIANEIVSLLSAFGHMFLISGAILGLTVLSWANSVGDLVSDIAMAKQGYPQMAVSACIGGPCLNMLLGVGLASTMYILRTGKAIELKLSGSLIISSAFLMFTICSHLVIVPLMKFKVRKWYGFYLFAVYILFLIIALLNITHVFEI